MSVPLSTSSSRISPQRWGRILAASLAIAAAFVGLLEWRLASRGFRATVIDSEDVWIKERRRASDLGSNALVLIGASRMQLDVDLQVLRKRTQLEPVQLAIDNSSFVPVLRGLAEDLRITGTVLVDFADNRLIPEQFDGSTRYQHRYDVSPQSRARLDFHAIEDWLGNLLHRHLRSYADGAQPITSLLMRAIPGDATPQYVITLPDRSRMADYTRIDMPGFYYRTVQRYMGLQEMIRSTSMAELDTLLRQRIKTTSPLDNRHYLAQIDRVMAYTQTIESRGGRVIFVVFPTDKLVRDYDEQATPRKDFYDRFASTAGGRAHHYADSSLLRHYRCPDGSHLDVRDRAHFTEDLVSYVGLDRIARRNR